VKQESWGQAHLLGETTTTLRGGQDDAASGHLGDPGRKEAYWVGGEKRGCHSSSAGPTKHPTHSSRPPRFPAHRHQQPGNPTRPKTGASGPGNYSCHPPPGNLKKQATASGSCQGAPNRPTPPNPPCRHGWGRLPPGPAATVSDFRLRRKAFLDQETGTPISPSSPSRPAVRASHQLRGISSARLPPVRAQIRNSFAGPPPPAWRRLGPPDWGRFRKARPWPAARETAPRPAFQGRRGQGRHRPGPEGPASTQSRPGRPNSPTSGPPDPARGRRTTAEFAEGWQQVRCG